MAQRLLNSETLGVALSAAALAMAGCGGPPGNEQDRARDRSPLEATADETADPPAAEPGCALALTEELPSLAEAFAEHFRMGAALDVATVSGTDDAAADLVRAQYNQISPENILKWSEVHPTLDTYRFGTADAFVEFGEEHDMQLYGHVLVWHQQTPEWVFQDEAGDQISAAALWERLEDHITQVAGRYGGRIAYWDVVNEALRDDGVLRDSPWRTILGDDYVAEVFALADKLLPDSRLVYNDYSMFVPAKRDAAIALILDMRERGIRVDAVGMQGHYNLRHPQPADVDAALTAYAAAGIDVLITELDLDVLPSERQFQGADLDDTESYSDLIDPYKRCLPQELDPTVAAHWGALFDVFVKHADTIEGITFWGVSDGQSWLNNWPVDGRTNYPLLFNRDMSAKTALDSVIDTTSP